MIFSTESLIESRMRTAELRNSIRVVKQNIDKTRFNLESNAIKQADGNYGKNAEERERFLKTAINESVEHSSLEQELISLQNLLELEEAKIEAYRDLRKEREMELKEKILDSGITLQEKEF